MKKAFAAMISGEYGLTEMILRCKNAIIELEAGKDLPNKFQKMQTDIAPYEAWRSDKITAIKACTTIEEVAAISVSYP